MFLPTKHTIRKSLRSPSKSDYQDIIQPTFHGNKGALNGTLFTLGRLKGEGKLSHFLLTFRSSNIPHGFVLISQLFFPNINSINEISEPCIFLKNKNKIKLIIIVILGYKLNFMALTQAQFGTGLGPGPKTQATGSEQRACSINGPI